MNAILPQHPGAATQRDRILEVLIAAGGHEVPSYELGRIALQYNARIKELRAAGYIIRNRTQRVNGQVHGYFWLEGVTPAIPPAASVAERRVDIAKPAQSQATEFLFTDWSPRHVDLG